jgi:hypothetical protein
MIYFYFRGVYIWVHHLAARRHSMNLTVLLADAKRQQPRAHRHLFAQMINTFRCPPPFNTLTIPPHVLAGTGVGPDRVPLYREDRPAQQIYHPISKDEQKRKDAETIRTLTIEDRRTFIF